MIGIVSSSAWAACEVIKETCLQGPETRIIGGEEIYRECWQWETVSECESGGSVNYCEPLESLSSCQQTETNCLESSKPGVCEVRENAYSCETPLEEVPEGITELPIKTEVTDRFETDKYCEAAVDSACSQTQMICTAPDETRVVDGVEVTLPCWEREFNFSCVIRPENPS